MIKFEKKALGENLSFWWSLDFQGWMFTAPPVAGWSPEPSWGKPHQLECRSHTCRILACNTNGGNGFGQQTSAMFFSKICLFADCGLQLFFLEKGVHVSLLKNVCVGDMLIWMFFSPSWKADQCMIPPLISRSIVLYGVVMEADGYMCVKLCLYT